MQDNKLIREWIKFASDDLFVAKHLFYEVNPKQLYISCYHCQQCAEKILKAVLLSFGLELLKIHDLNKLCNLCTEKDNSFEEIQELCAFINPYGIDAKYPNELELYDEIVMVVLNRTQSIYDFCKAKIN
ncbi:MAG: HEPN domain-containing protein [Chitinivibrionia bacterium]|nr:HEPN domain-containing protein [Chitinivibrionia bacterium]